jgi:DNA-binding MarR family transcriptional regulator
LKGKYTVEMVLKALEKLTTEGGVAYRSPSVRDIAEEVGCSHMMVYLLIRDAEQAELLQWPTDGDGRRIPNAIAITEKGQEELEAWRKEQERQTALA